MHFIYRLSILFNLTKECQDVYNFFFLFHSIIIRYSCTTFRLVKECVETEYWIEILVGSNCISEENAKKLIKEQKYLEAIEILRAISLNNPKKSANFALQIKFLETIINNHNKN